MAFKDYKAATVTLQTNSEPISLRGLNVEDFGYLIQRHGALMDIWFDGNFDPLAILTKAPALVADVIACAADEPEAADKAAVMPIGLQVHAVAEIFKLTFAEVDMGERLGVFLAGFMSAKSPSPSTPAI